MIFTSIALSLVIALQAFQVTKLQSIKLAAPPQPLCYEIPANISQKQLLKKLLEIEFPSNRISRIINITYQIPCEKPSRPQCSCLKQLALSLPQEISKEETLNTNLTNINKVFEFLSANLSSLPNAQIVIKKAKQDLFLIITEFKDTSNPLQEKFIQNQLQNTKKDRKKSRSFFKKSYSNISKKSQLRTRNNIDHSSDGEIRLNITLNKIEDWANSFQSDLKNTLVVTPDITNNKSSSNQKTTSIWSSISNKFKHYASQAFSLFS